MALNFIPTNTKIDFVKYRFIYFFISMIIVFGSFSLVHFKGLNYGIDFRGGFLISIRTADTADMADLRLKLSKLNVGEASLQQMGTPRDVQIKIDNRDGDASAQAAALAKIKTGLGANIEYRSIETVGPKAGQELITNAITAVALALLAMFGYVWVRFEWQFAVSSTIGVFHDCVAIIGMYALFGHEFGINAIMGVMVTAGYSINDTIVIFDRIRENLVKYKKMSLAELINKSTNETLSRTILTSSTTLLAVLALYIFGGELISSYSLPIIVGIIVGTYSSIFLSAPLMLHLGFRRDRPAPTKPERNAA